MRAGLKYHWLNMANTRGLEANWDPDLFFPVNMEEDDFTIEVRKSPLKFTVRESPMNSDRYVVSCVEYPPGHASAASTGLLALGSLLQAKEVDDRLEDWLLYAVANYVSEHNPDE